MTEVPITVDAGWPLAVALMLLLPLLVLSALTLEARRRRARLSAYATPGALPRLGASASVRSGRVWRLTLAMALAGAALAGPRWGAAASVESRRGLDIAVALDASLSMLAEDERPSRLERMKQEVRRLRAASRADRLAIIAFAGRSYILTPLTADEGALELYLENLSPESVGQAGTSLARSIRQGVDLLGASTGGADRVLVLMSDGEAFEPEEDVRAAAAEAAAQGIMLITVGFGSADGATIPERVGNAVREKRDERGQVVITRYMPELLAAAADAAGGVFIGSDASDRAGRVRAAMAGLRTERRLVASREDQVPRYAWFLTPALLLLALETWRARQSAGPAARTREIGAASSLVPVLLFLCGTSALGACTRRADPGQLLEAGDALAAVAGYRARVAEGDTSLTTRYNLGTALLAADSLTEALELLEGARRGSDGDLRARARFNEGLAQLLRARVDSGETADAAYAAARELYRAYLGEQWQERDAKWNYELALRPTEGGGGGGGGSDDASSESQEPEPTPTGQLDQAQAEALLSAAARDEREVQGKRQRMTRQPPPPGGRDW